MPPLAVDDKTTIHYESLDNLYDKTPPPNNKVQPPSNKINTCSVDDDDQLPAEEEYMKMTPSCSHVTIKSDTIRSCDFKSHQTEFVGEEPSNRHYNSLPSHYNHYDVPASNSLHSNTINDNYYDTPRNNTLASTK